MATNEPVYQQKQTYGRMALDELFALALRDFNTCKHFVSDLTREDMPDMDMMGLYDALDRQVKQDKFAVMDVKAHWGSFIGAEFADTSIDRMIARAPSKDEYHTLITHVKTATKWRLFNDVVWDMSQWDAITDIDENLAGWIPKLQGVMDTAADVSKSTASIKEVLREYVPEVQRLMKLDRDVTGFETGYQQLDEAINGLEPATLTVIGAKTSIGKSFVGINLAVGAMQRHHYGIDRQPACAIFSMEMSKQQVARRIISCLGQVLFSKLKKPRHMSSEDTQKFVNGSAKTGELPLKIIDGGKTVEQICAESRRLHIRGELDFILIDHLHNIRYTGDGNSQKEIKHITGRLVDLKNELNVPIILLAQCNRGAGTAKAPLKEHLEGAGAIEQDADNVIMLHRKDKYIESDDTQTPRDNIIELISGKEREGEPFYIRYGFDGAYQTMRENPTDVNTPFGDAA